MHLHGSINGFNGDSPVDKQIRHYLENSFLSSSEQMDSSFNKS